MHSPRHHLSPRGKSSRTRNRITVVLALTLVASACAGADDADPDRSFGAAADIPGLESVAVWQGGAVVAEHYVIGAVDTPRDVRSVTKSVTSLLIGAAIDDGLIDSVDQSIGGVIPDLAAAYGSDRAQLRIRDLLTMAAGLEWDETELDEYTTWRASPNPIDHYLSRPIVAGPGERFEYTSAASHLLGQVVEAASGSTLDEYAKDRLFHPLGIDDVQWERLADGSVNAASGLDLKTTDMITLGRMVLNGGVWDGRRIVSSEWIETSTSPHITGPDGTQYGFQWWIEDEPVRLAVASGYGGQTLAIAPEIDLVVVATGAWNIPAEDAERQAGRIVGFLRDAVQAIAER